MLGSFMKNKKTALLLSCLLIAFMAIANLIRLFWEIPLSMGHFQFPSWTGAIGFLAFGLLSCWSFKELYALDRLIKTLHQKKEAELPRPPLTSVEPTQNLEVEDLILDTPPELNKN
jgi:hypothetical protein